MNTLIIDKYLVETVYTVAARKNADKIGNTIKSMMKKADKKINSDKKMVDKYLADGDMLSLKQLEREYSYFTGS